MIIQYIKRKCRYPIVLDELVLKDNLEIFHSDIAGNPRSKRDAGDKLAGGSDEVTSRKGFPTPFFVFNKCVSS
jgi:hypothetical protein